MVKKFVCLFLALAIVITGTPASMLAYATDTAQHADNVIEQNNNEEGSADTVGYPEGSKEDAEAKTNEESEPAEDVQEADGKQDDAEKNEEAGDPEEEKKPETMMAEQTVKAKGENGEYEISVSGMLPEGASLQVTEILEGSRDKTLPQYDELVESTAEKIYEDDEFGEGDTLPYARFFDITILDKEGKVFEPEEKLTLSIDLKDKALDTKDVDFTAVHFTEDSDAELVPVEIQEAGTEAKNGNDAEKAAVLEAESFSVYGVVYSYTVDFYYTEGDTSTEYHMNGGSEMMMSELFDKLGIDRRTKDIESVEFTDETLVSFTKSGRDYTVKSLKPFTTGEQLTISFSDGASIVIRVEDAQYQWWFSGGDVYASLDTNTGKLIIRPKDSLGGASGSAQFKRDMDKKSSWPWDSYRNSIKEVEFQGNLSSDSENRILMYMFADCRNLTKVTGLDHFDTTNLASMARMFSGCTKLEEVDISSFKNNGSMQNMQNMFNGSGVVTVKMPGSDFKVKDNALLTGMFQDCTKLKTVEFNGMDVTGAKTMTNMFSGCTSLEKLDVSSFGTLTNIVNMDGFVQGCTSLEELNISNLDNSAIKPYRALHATNPAWGHDLGINKDSTPDLKTLKADNSRVYMCKNTAGSPDNQPYDASYEKDVVYFTDKQAVFTFSDGVASDGVAVTIATRRDYIDLITDRNEDGARGSDSLSENSTNKMEGLNTNGAGFLAPGTYVIGTKKRTDPKPENIPKTRYRITGMGDSEPEVEIVNNPDGLLKEVWDGSDIYIKTVEKERSFWNGQGNNEYTVSAGDKPLITITYPGVAEDFYGNKHDVTLTIKSITFKEIDRITKKGDTDSKRRHNTNYYADDSYYRTILMAKNGSLEFQNYVYSEDAWRYWNSGSGSWQDYGDRKVLSNGSGTWIDYDIKVEDAPENSTLLFYIDDLDVPHWQEWDIDPDDACYDYLPWKDEDGNYKVHYGAGSEGMILGEGNNLETLTFGAHTGLQLIKSKTDSEKNDYVVATGSDPSTSWSEFYVQAAATGASYTWTSGIGCTTYLLKNTDPPEPPEDAVLTTLKAEKILEGRPWRDSDKFDIALVVHESDTTTPLPKDKQTIVHNDLHYHYVTITDSDGVQNDPSDSIRRQKSLGKITYTIEDMKDEHDVIQKEKIFEYTVQELSPELGESPRIDAVTYSTEEYTAYVKVVLDDTTNPDVPKLKIESVTYKNSDGEFVDIARFTNTYDAGETIDYLAAVKNYHDVNEDKGIDLEGGDFEFAIKPIGENAAIAPMPKDSTGTGEKRVYTAKNIDTGEILFKDRAVESDGLVFNYQALLDAGVSDAVLHSSDGVAFEYEMYEVIPDAGPDEVKTNNGNSTWSITNTKTGVVTVYDDIHHTRKITVKVRNIDGKEELHIEDHADTDKADFFIDKDGNEKLVSELEGYDPDMYHIHPDGDPIFVNFRFQQKYADIKVKKVWNDKNDRDGIRPSSVQAVIANNAFEPLDESITLKGLFWTKTLKDQPVYKFDVMHDEKEQGVHSKLMKVEYTLEEKMGGIINGDENTGYAPGYDFDSPFTLDEEETEKVLTITNTHVPEDMYKVTYLDGDHGRSDGGTEMKKYGDRPQKNKVTPDNGYEFTGEYTYVITNKSGDVIGKGTTRDPRSITVIGNIVFTPYYKEIIYTVTYENGDHGKSDGGKENKKYGETPQGNTVTPDSGYRFTGKYKYVITDKSGKVIKTGTTDDPQSIKVTGDIVFTPIYEKIPGKGSGGSGTNTGDSNKLIPIAGALAAALAALLALILKRKRGS